MTKKEVMLYYARYQELPFGQLGSELRMYNNTMSGMTKKQADKYKPLFLDYFFNKGSGVSVDDAIKIIEKLEKVKDGKGN